MAEVDIKDLAQTIASFSAAQCEKLINSLDAEVLADLKVAIQSTQEDSKSEEPQEQAETEPEADTAGAMAESSANVEKLSQQMKEMSAVLETQGEEIKRLNEELKSVTSRVSQLERGGGGGSGGGSGRRAASVESKSDDEEEKKDAKSPRGGKKKGGRKKPRPLQTMKVERPDSSVVVSTPTRERLHGYYFGTRKVMVVKPTEGYPTPKEAMLKPQAALQLRRAHGYAGNHESGRQNLYITPEGDCLIYFIAALAVVMNVKDGSQRFFAEHNDDVTCICLDPCGRKWVATGQKDPKDRPGEGKDLPKVWIWNYESMEKVQLLDEMCWGKVSKVQFSGRTGFLHVLCGDEDQTLKVFDPETFTGGKKKRKILPVFHKGTMKNEIFGIEFNPRPGNGVDEFVTYGPRQFAYGIIEEAKGKMAMKLKQVPILSVNKDGEKAFLCCAWLEDGRYAVGAASGGIYIAREKGVLSFIKAAHDRACTALLLAGNRLISGGFDHELKKWSIGGPEKKKKALTQKWNHKVEVADSDFKLNPKAMAYDATGGTLYVGTKTNQILRYEMKSEESEVIVDGHDGSIWGLCTHPGEPIFATGGYDNAVKVWDSVSMRCIRTCEFPLEMGDKKGKRVTCAAWSNCGTILAFGTSDSNIGLFNWPEFVFQGFVNIPPKSKKAEIEAVAYVRFSPDNTMLACAHMDANLYIFDVVKGDTITLERWSPCNHVAAPTNLQWNGEGTMVKTITRDYEVVHWRLNAKKRKGEFVPNIPDPDTARWADDPLIAGWDVEGLYQSQLSWDGTDLNDATLSADGKLLASGDDYGIVRLHNYPAIDPEANFSYRGHAEFVVGVEFLRDDSELVTCGGDDMAIFQWTLHKNY